MVKWWVSVIVGAVGLFVGYKLNQKANLESEKRIIDALTAEIESLKQKQKTSRLTTDEQAKLNALNQTLQLIKNA